MNSSKFAGMYLRGEPGADLLWFSNLVFDNNKIIIPYRGHRSGKLISIEGEVILTWGEQAQWFGVKNEVIGKHTWKNCFYCQR